MSRAFPFNAALKSSRLLRVFSSVFHSILALCYASFHFPMIPSSPLALLLSLALPPSWGRSLTSFTPRWQIELQRGSKPRIAVDWESQSPTPMTTPMTPPSVDDDGPAPRADGDGDGGEKSDRFFALAPTVRSRKLIGRE